MTPNHLFEGTTEKLRFSIPCCLRRRAVPQAERWAGESHGGNCGVWPVKWFWDKGVCWLAMISGESKSGLKEMAIFHYNFWQQSASLPVKACSPRRKALTIFVQASQQRCLLVMRPA